MHTVDAIKCTWVRTHQCTPVGALTSDHTWVHTHRFTTECIMVRLGATHTDAQGSVFFEQCISADPEGKPKP
eukprot:1157881-Pelagomonas_calceolata.AAC.2